MRPKSLIFIAISLFLFGCAATVPMESATKDAELKKFVPKDNLAGIYIYRSEEDAVSIKASIEIDGDYEGDLAAGTFLYKEVSPGKHTILSKAENKDCIELNADAGRLYYLWQDMKRGVFFARSKLSIVNEKEGQTGVLLSNLAITRNTSVASLNELPRCP
ncbi:DUF2846 domain-containing protein [Herminiimonas glaciei]|uniref:DUF2846 domain-containing protein n=1 Tax=Herminiimonas glaciei TaxID=523788 RepID=A0ABW2IBE6_9BURK